MEIQNYITNGTKEGAGYVPGISPYLPSRPPPSGKGPYSPLPSVTPAKCANGDVACISGVGVQLPPVMSPEQREAAGAYFGELSSQYQRASALATVSGNMPIATSFEIAAGVSALVEQALIPSTGKVLVDALVDQSAQAFSRSSGISLFIVNEVVERQIKPQLQSLRNLVDEIAGNKK